MADQKHTAKSVGLAPAFPNDSDVIRSDGKGMTFAAWLYGQNVNSTYLGQTQKEINNPNIKLIAGCDAAKHRTLSQLQSIAELLNELEAGG